MTDYTLGIADGTGPFRIAAIQRSLDADLLIAADWPLLAAEALAAGADSPRLRELAGEPRSTPALDVRELVERVVDDLGYRSPDRETSKTLLAAVACTWMLDGTWTLTRGFERIVVSISQWHERDTSAASARLEDRFLGLYYEDDDDVTFTAFGDRPGQYEKAAEYEAWVADLERRRLEAVRAELAGRNVGELIRRATDPAQV